MCLAIPGRLTAITGDGDLRIGRVDFGGVSRDVSLVFVPEAASGDYVLVHVGFAIARIDEEVAAQALEDLAALEILGDAAAASTSPMQAGAAKGAAVMRHLDEYRDPAAIRAVVERIARTMTRPATLMEVCGGQTHAILKFGLDQLLPDGLRLLHGPGCPVCVTPLEQIDRALVIAARPDVIFCSFGDMLRVPGSSADLLLAKARGADVRIVYSPMDAVDIARREPARRVVFFAVGFETTAPANAMAAFTASREGLDNFSMLVSHVLVPPALDALLGAEGCEIQALLAPGHVCVVTGQRDYEVVSARYRIPIVVTGFEPLDLLTGVLAAVRQLERGDACVENEYARVASPDGNPGAMRLVREVFDVCDRKWRGLGEILASGYGLAARYAHVDAERVFGVENLRVDEPDDCPSGLVLQGRLLPTKCPHFGKRCTSEHPLGAPMVSSEGACAAYFHYGTLPAPDAAAWSGADAVTEARP